MTMFDLEKAIGGWKRTMRRSPSIEECDLAELERYLRDKVDELGREGLEPEEAFRTAEAEFEKASNLDEAYGHARAARPGRRFPWRPSRFQPALAWSHVRIALRRLRRQKVFSLINVGGLALGLACALLIFIWVADELGYDRFHVKADRVFRVVSSTSQDGSPTNANTAFGLGPALKKDFPEVLKTVRIKKMDQNPKRYVGYQDRKFYEPRLFFAEPAVFSVFDFPLLKGDPATALKDPGSIVLTEDMAEKYFGAEEPMGRIIESDPYGTGTLMLFRVTGVARNVPRRSHFHFDFLASYASMQEDTQALSPIYQHYTYALLRDPAAAGSLRPRLLDFLKRNWGPDPWYSIGLQPLLDTHLRSGLRSEIEPAGSILYVYVFSAIALAVLLIACINFMNLSTARSAQRAKEIAIRKTVGAPKSKLVRQFIGEALTISLVATVGRAYSPLDFEGGGEGQTQVVYAVDKDFAATYGLQLLAGRWIARTPTAAGPAEMLIGELSARRAGYASPQDAIGKRVDITTPEGRDSAQIVGVVKDILIASLHRPPDPLVYIAAPIDRHEFISLRIRGDRAAEALALLQKTWPRTAPSYPLDYFFLDDSFAQLHQAERRMSRLFVVFSGLAIAIACLGLFGLAAHMAERRTKEIGIRKILGASTPALYVCLSRDLLKWVALANVFAWPIAFTVMQIWLRNFAFRIRIGWWVFPLGAGLALAVAALTVGSQTLRAIRHNPVDSLRYE
jgi:hypothetical protein